MAIENPDELRQDARRFDTEIKKAGATTILFVPWSHREHPEQQTIITDVYLSLARELHAVIAPVGPAWQSLLTDNPQIPLYRPDQDSHPNANGSYLAACVLYAIIYRKSPEGISSEITDQGMRRHEFDPLDKQIKEEPFRLSPSDALLLQRTAWQVAKEFE
jgi:hypothetical protein